MDKKILDKIMKPKSIAVIGASSKEHTIGSDIMKRLITYKFTGKIFPINIKGGLIQGIQSYKKLSEVKEEIDLAIIVINVKFVLNAIDECNEKGIKGIVIITSGFKETGEKGAQIEKELGEKIKKYGMRCVGPNGLGVVNTNLSIRMDGCFAETIPERGHIGLVSQSGALGGGMFNVLKDLNIGIAQFISIGNQIDVNVETALEYWEDDDDVKEIVLYMETITDPKKFRELASRISKKKPIIALKAGRSEEGSKAAASHTGSLAGSDIAANALLIQSGCIREFTLSELLESSKAFLKSPVPKGDRIAIITNSGGPGIMATDSIVSKGMKIAQLSEKTKNQLRSFLPIQASVNNPIDMIASAPLEHYEKALEIVSSDENVDMIVTIYLPFLGLKDVDVAKTLIKSKDKHPDKPLVGVIMTNNKFFTDLSDLSINMPFYMCSEESTEGLARLNQYRKWVMRPKGNIKSFEVNKEKAISIFKNVINENRSLLTTEESFNLLSSYGIKSCQHKIAKNIDEAVYIANEIGYPVVMKISSKKTSHKSDIGGVILNITDTEILKNEYEKLMNNLKNQNLVDDLEGVIIQQQVDGKRELVCGVSTDSHYGKLIMFGFGGIFVEIIKDISFRLLPITDQDAKDIIMSTKCYKILQEFRGNKPANIEQIEEILMRISQLCTDFNFINELDINPLLINSEGSGISVDARIVINIEKAKSFLNI